MTSRRKQKDSDFVSEQQLRSVRFHTNSFLREVRQQRNLNKITFGQAGPPVIIYGPIPNPPSPTRKLIPEDFSVTNSYRSRNQQQRDSSPIRNLYKETLKPPQSFGFHSSEKTTVRNLDIVQISDNYLRTMSAFREANAKLCKYAAKEDAETVTATISGDVDALTNTSDVDHGVLCMGYFRLDSRYFPVHCSNPFTRSADHTLSPVLPDEDVPVK